MSTPKKVDRSFASLTEFVNFAMREPEGEQNRSTSARSSRTTSMSEWYGTKSFSEASDMAFNWPDGADRVNRLRAKVSLGNVQRVKVVVPQRKAPGRIDMGRVMQGHPYGFQRVIDGEEFKQGQSRNVVDILINACVSAGVDANVIEARGAAVLALAEALEQRGKRVRITVGMANNRGCGIDYRVVVKQPGQPLNLNSVAFAVAHPSFFRRFIFSAMETESASVCKSVGIGAYGYGYGMVGEFRDVPKDTIYMGGADFRRSTQWNDTGYVQTWIKDTLREQGINID